METGRIRLFKAYKQFMYDNGNSETFNKKYPNYETWISLNFNNSTSFEDFYLKLSKMEFIKSEFSLEQFYTKYACDLEWAKKTIYCKTEKKPVVPKDDTKKPITPKDDDKKQDTIPKIEYIYTSGESPLKGANSNQGSTQSGTETKTQQVSPGNVQSGTPQRGRVIKTTNPNDW